MHAETVARDFDELARLSDQYSYGADRYFSFLASLIPKSADSVLDIGCGLGRLTVMLAATQRRITAVDMSPEMIVRARKRAGDNPLFTFICGDFLAQDFSSRQFDCIVTTAALHHMPVEIAVPRMVELLQPRGRLIIHDLRSDQGLQDRLRSCFALGHQGIVRFARTGRPRTPRPVRAAWERHGAAEEYLTFAAARQMAARLLPGAALFYHWLWRYTVVWDKPEAERKQC